MTKRKASEGHIRGLEIDYQKASAEDRPGFLRHIVYARWGQSSTWKGRFGILDEIANGAYETAPDKAALQTILETIGKDIQAYIDGAAMRNKDTKPGVVAMRLADASRRVTLDKTGAKTRLGDDMPKDTKPAQPSIEPTPEFKPGLFPPAENPRPLDEFVPPSEPTAEAPVDDKPTCLNDWALDKDKRRLFIEKVDGLAFDAMIDAKNARAWGLGILGVPDETQIAMSAADAIKAIKATLPKSEPTTSPEPPAEPERPMEPAPQPQQPTQSPTTILAQITTLAGIPIKDMRRKLDAKYDPKDYKAIKLSGGRQGTDVNSYAVRDRIEQVFGPHGLGWKIEPHSILGAVNIERETTTGANGERSVWVVSLIEHVFSYRIILPDGTLEWVELSVMSDSADNSDKGYAYRSAFTSLLKQVVRSLGGLNHLRNS